MHERVEQGDVGSVDLSFCHKKPPGNGRGRCGQIFHRRRISTRRLQKLCHKV